MPEYPITQDFPKLPPKLRSIAGEKEAREFEKQVEEWRRQNQVVIDRYTDTVVKEKTESVVKEYVEKNISTIIQLAGVTTSSASLSLKLVDVVISSNGAILGGTPFNLKLDTQPDTVLKTYGKLLCRDASGKLLLVAPPQAFDVGDFKNPFLTTNAAGFVRLGPQVRRILGVNSGASTSYITGLTGGSFTSGSIRQLWYPGYFIRSSATANIGAKLLVVQTGTDTKVGQYLNAPVYDGGWIDLNTNGSSWQGNWTCEGLSFGSFPVTNVV